MNNYNEFFFTNKFSLFQLSQGGIFMQVLKAKQSSIVYQISAYIPIRDDQTLLCYIKNDNKLYTVLNGKEIFTEEINQYFLDESIGTKQKLGKEHV